MSLLEVKSLQYLLIVKAGLAVTEGPEKSIERLQSDVIIEYNLAVTNVKLPVNLKHIDRSCLIRSKNQLAPKTKHLPAICTLGLLYGGNTMKSEDMSSMTFLSPIRGRCLVVNHRLGKITMKF